MQLQYCVVSQHDCEVHGNSLLGRRAEGEPPGVLVYTSRVTVFGDQLVTWLKWCVWRQVAAAD